MAILVCGGAGYIGGHMALLLQERGEEVIVLDNLSNSRADMAPASGGVVECDIRDVQRLERIVATSDIDAVFHFAASIEVERSVREPLPFYDNNVCGTYALLTATLGKAKPHWIFSSSAAVYGPVESALVDERHPLRPISPYGASKAACEWMVAHACAAAGARWVNLRYFNVAGADPHRRHGQYMPGGGSLFKTAIEAALGQRSKVQVFGTDYATPDGTGVRDYIHVSDLVGAHYLALDHLRRGGASATLNCGYGRGSSVYEVIGAVERASGRSIPVEFADRRPGDAAQVVADNTAIRSLLDWFPLFDDLDLMAEHAVAWARRLDGSSPQRTTNASVP